MAGVKGRSGTNKNKDKPFADALRMEINAAGDDHKRLRRIAAKLIEMAERGDMQAIAQVADRLDGKPAQESSMTVTRVNASELSDNELADIAAGGSENAAVPALDPQKLN
jgi:hypothetical protein